MSSYLVTRYNWCGGRPIFEVPRIPFVSHSGQIEGYRPRYPEAANGTNFYSALDERVCVAASVELTTYLRRRAYAKEMGVAVYHPYGSGSKDWIPDEAYERQMLRAVRAGLTNDYQAGVIFIRYESYDYWLRRCFEAAARNAEHTCYSPKCKHLEEAVEYDGGWCSSPANRHPSIRGCPEGCKPGVTSSTVCDLWEIGPTRYGEFRT